MGISISNFNVVSISKGSVQATRAYLGSDFLWSQDSVVMSVVGTSFEPILELAEDSEASVTWVDSSGIIGVGVAPTISWEEVGPHNVRLIVDQPEDVITLNLGFHYAQDNGIYSLSSSYNHPTQPVVEITNLSYLSGLERFMAARTNGISDDGSLYTGPLLGGSLDFSGMSNLEYIECYQSDVHEVTLTGCSSLIRLCLEQCDLTSLDLNPVRTTLLDLRVAYQRGQSLELTTLNGPLEELYHFCTRRQALTGMPNVETMLPKVQQLWNWRNSLVLDEVAVRSSEPLHTVLLCSASAGGVENVIKHLDLQGQTWGPSGGSGSQRLDAFGVAMESIDLTGMGPVPTLNLYNNLLDEASVDHVLAVADAWGGTGSSIRLDGNAPPSAAGIVSANNLRSRGWSVQHDSPTTLVWSDEFDRADAVGFANSGGWFPQVDETDTDVAIVNQQLVLSGTTGYRRFYNLGNGNLPADCEVVLGFTIADASEPGPWWGIASHASPTGNSGRRVLFRASETILRIGNTSNATDQGDIDVSALLPATWKDPGQHELTLRTVGTSTTVLADGVPIASRSFAINAGTSGLAVGIVGQPLDRAWDYIRVYAI